MRGSVRQRLGTAVLEVLAMAVNTAQWQMKITNTFFCTGVEPLWINRTGMLWAEWLPSHGTISVISLKTTQDANSD